MEAWIKMLPQQVNFLPQLIESPEAPECKHVAASTSTGANKNARAPNTTRLLNIANQTLRNQSVNQSTSTAIQRCVLIEMPCRTGSSARNGSAPGPIMYIHLHFCRSPLMFCYGKAFVYWRCSTTMLHDVLFTVFGWDFLRQVRSASIAHVALLQRKPGSEVETTRLIDRSCGKVAVIGENCGTAHNSRGLVEVATQTNATSRNPGGSDLKYLFNFFTHSTGVLIFK